jgi:hypothetical protein
MLTSKIPYTFALLVISSLLLAEGTTKDAQEQLVGHQEEYLARILSQKEEITALLAENEKRLREALYNQDEVVRKGDFYSKSVYPSTQIFFNFAVENNGKMKDRTEEEYKRHLMDIVFDMTAAGAAKSGGGGAHIMRMHIVL